MVDLVRLTTCLWFDRQAEEAARFYVSIFGGEIDGGADYPESDFAAHEGRAGTPMVVTFRIGGMEFVALNGGPQFTHSPAISFQVHCDTQAEIDHYWDRLTAGGDPEAQRCGWLKDRFGVSWQVVPSAMPRLMGSDDPERAARVMKALIPMTRLDLAALEAAWAG
jgi:predicted 3-demethylubiquinone-9 3-methyltransferase (glyoxalase superfamily)